MQGQVSEVSEEAEVSKVRGVSARLVGGVRVSALAAALTATRAAALVCVPLLSLAADRAPGSASLPPSPYAPATPVPAQTDVPWPQRSYEDRLYNGRYEDLYTFRHGKPYVVDTWVWAYSKAFADRFHMPSDWVETGLKGAWAVAFRMTTLGSEKECGFGQNPSSCAQPLNCQLDVYYDNTIRLPWNYPEVVRDNLMPQLHSGRFLHDPGFRSRGVGRHFYGRQSASDNDHGKPMGVMNSGGALRYGRYSLGGSTLVLFDREYHERVGLISWIGQGVCPSYTGPENVFMRFEDPADLSRASEGKIRRDEVKVMHQIDFPVGFLKRANAVYEKSVGGKHGS